MRVCVRVCVIQWQWGALLPGCSWGLVRARYGQSHPGIPPIDHSECAAKSEGAGPEPPAVGSSVFFYAPWRPSTSGQTGFKFGWRAGRWPCGASHFHPSTHVPERGVPGVHPQHLMHNLPLICPCHVAHPYSLNGAHHIGKCPERHSCGTFTNVTHAIQRMRMGPVAGADEGADDA